MKKNKAGSNTIAYNKKARFEYHIEKTIEAGVSLLGWEVKSIRQGKVQLGESYVLLKDGEAYLFGAHISPGHSASSHVNTDPIRSRKLLLNRHELNSLIGEVERQGYALIVLSMYWSRGKVKLSIALGKGKKLHDKRMTEKQRDWQRDKQRLMRDYK